MVELSLAHLFDVFARYGETARDFLIRLRPRRFAQAVHANPAEYVRPFYFAVTSLIISAVCAFTLGAFLLVGSDRETLFHLGIWGCLAIVVAAWLENLYIVAAAKVAAFVLGVTSSFTDLLDGYCYASILFPLFIITSELFIFGPEQPSVTSLLFLTAVQVLFLGLACVAMVSFVGLHPRYAWRACLGTSFVVFGTGVALFSAIDALDQPARYEVHPLSALEARLNGSFLAPDHYRVEHCDRATLNGHVETNSGAELTAWFEWGDTPELNNITVVQHFTVDSAFHQDLSGLKPNTTYYYRGVVSSKNGSSKGKIYSFTTARCQK